MVSNVVDSGNRGTPLDDVAYLARSEHRIPTLVALTARPRSRSELWELAGVSSSTIRRTLSEFEDRDWIYKEDYKYEATQTGEFVASAMVDMLERVEAEHSLRDVWQFLPDEDSGFTIEMCADSTVTVANADDPYRPVNRFTSLLQDTDDLRFVGLDVAMFEPCKDDLCDRIIEGMNAEIITASRFAEYIRSTCSDLMVETLETGDLTVWLREELPPWGVGILDDRIVISGYDPDSVSVRVVIDTDDPDAREWAESTYESHRRETPTIPLQPDEE